MYEKVQISKSKPKKFSFLCTFKAQDWHIKPSLAQLMDRISEKLVLAHIKGIINEKKKIYIFDLAQNFFSFRVVLKVHRIEIFFGFDFEICIISLIVMWKY